MKAASGSALPQLIGLAKGTPNSPVSVDQIERLKGRILSNGASAHGVDRVVTNDTRAEQREFERRSGGSAKDIVGYGIAWSDGSPDITIQYLPKHMPASEAEMPTRRAHTKLDNFAAAHQNNE